MIKVLLVDDEPLFRQALRKQIPWGEFDMNIVGDASDGNKALEFVKQHDIDIVFTDMKMPHMGGIELIGKIKELNSGIDCVAVSSYSELKLVKDAFKLGSIDYILKEDMDDDSMHGLLAKLQQLSLKRKGNATLTQYTSSMLRTRELTPENQLFFLLSVEVPSVMYGAVYERAVVLENKFPVLIVERHNRPCMIGWIEQTENFNGHVEELQHVSDILLYLQHNVTRNITLGISSFGTHENLESLIEQAIEALRLSFYDANRMICTFRDLPKESLILTKEIVSEGLVESLKQFNPAGLNQTVAYVMDKLEEYVQPKSVVIAELIDMYYKIINHMSAIELIHSVAPPSVMQLAEEMKSFNKFAELRKAFLSWISEILNRFEQEKQKNLISFIKSYIDENLSKDLSLTDIADHFAISNGHLSRLLARGLGMHFKEYVNNLRVQKAQFYMVNTDLRIHEIADKIGYQSTEHFSRVFKQVVGMSPKSYREKKFS